MAVAVIGGLVTSTFLSLLIIPVVFTFVDDLINLTKRLFGSRASGAAGIPARNEAPVACLRGDGSMA